MEPLKNENVLLLREMLYNIKKWKGVWYADKYDTFWDHFGRNSGVTMTVPN